MVVPLLSRKATWSEFEAFHWDDANALKNTTSTQPPFTGGYLGVIPYEHFTAFDDGAKPLLSASDAALLFDQQTKEFFVATRNQGKLAQALEEATAILALAEETVNISGQVTLDALESNESYEQKVEQALADIRNGRYYQINLLRYFTVKVCSDLVLATLLSARGGPWSAWIRQGSTDVISFSPEQFTQVTALDGHWLATTRPIKGTAPRHRDKALDQRAAEALKSSAKDRAELHMIIDLMRNDLARISTPGSVLVTESDELQSFVNVHHLVGRVEGVLKQGLSTSDFLKALCPAGSITGAPKIEVMRAIREAEGRPRGYFMGTAFLRDRNGRFDSSVLIRTIVRTREGSGNKYEFSAGSGIVISSDPRNERLEIDAKCNVLFPGE